MDESSRKEEKKYFSYNIPISYKKYGEDFPAEQKCACLVKVGLFGTVECRTVYLKVALSEKVEGFSNLQTHMPNIQDAVFLGFLLFLLNSG